MTSLELVEGGLSQIARSGPTFDDGQGGMEIRRLVVRMAMENPTWGYTRIQAALKNVGHRVARSTIASILRAEGLPPSRERPMTGRAFLRAHWPALIAADCFTTEFGPLRHLRRTIAEFVTHYHAERNHQGIGNELIQPLRRADGHGRVCRRQRVGGVLNYY